MTLFSAQVLTDDCLSSFPQTDRQTGSVLAAAMTGASSFIRQQGCDPDIIARSVGLQIADDLPPTLALRLEDYCNLFEEVARQSGRYDTGLAYGQQFQPDQLGLIGYIALTSATLGDALINLAELFPYHQRATQTRLVRMADGFRIEYRITDPLISRRAQDAELTMGMFCNVFRRALGKSWHPDAVWFEHTCQSTAADYAAAFDAPVFFQRGTTALLFSDVGLDVPMPAANAGLLSVLRESLTRLDHSQHLTTDGRDDLLLQARREVRTMLPQGIVKLPVLAEKLGVPRWTLQRRLESIGVTYTNLVDETRRSLAQTYLRQKGVSIGEIAYLLGYSEVSAFSRAFRKWYGVSPQAFRKEL
ncbi:MULTISPECIES: AraC family transcriptional regulator [Acetobacter]|uniref:AraC family transcriptional regulator n=1 Tax=Acetobacter tropicalis TaxID=104102 RepID=A0A291PDF3_9PROT|nr:MULTISPECIES: AraC family transcriptional regulator [Acetobacter]ATJ89385.1 AraC family transcriptional regulator [Acetobacter tropicalis]MCC6103909.1 AraC family transcriptional regulator [Acetobacter sp.]MCP1195078.1 AraC family transcriptional regulator [Acetobacter senegalensis]